MGVWWWREEWEWEAMGVEQRADAADRLADGGGVGARQGWVRLIRSGGGGELGVAGARLAGEGDG